MEGDNGVIFSLLVLLGIIIFIGVIFLFGLIMRHIIIPTHDRIWKYKRRNRKGDLKEVFMDGLFFLIMVLWFPFILILTLGSLYIAASAVVEKNVLNTIIGIALSTFFGAKLGYMLEHRSHAKKRWKRKKK
jgi:predicted permease